LVFVATLWCNMCFLSLSLSLFPSLAVGRVRVSLSSLQLLVVSFIVWIECDPELVMEDPGSFVVLI